MMRFRNASLSVIVLLIGLATLVFQPSSSAALSGCLEPEGQWQLGPTGVVATAGNLAVYSRGVTIEIADVTDPSNPVILGVTEIGGAPAAIAVSGTLAFVAADDEGFFVIDFANPSAPSVVGQWGGQTNQAWDIAASDDHVYVAYGRLIVVDVSDPTSPVEVARESTWAISKLELVGNYVYGASGSWLVAFDVSDPTTPEIVFHESGPYSSHLAANDQRLLMTDAGRLSVYTLDNPASPVFVTEYNDPATYFQSMAIDGTHAYITTYHDEFAIVDTTDPANPSTTATIAVPGDPRYVAVSDQTAYLTAEEGGLRIIDVADSTGPIEVGSIPAYGGSWDLAVSGDHAFVAENESGLRVFDVSNPDAPSPVGFLALDNAYDVTLDGSRAVVAGREAGIFVVDVSDPLVPTLLGEFDTPDEAWETEVVGDLVYVADGDSGLRIYDISDPSSIHQVGAMTSVSSAMDVAIAGDVAYLADCNWGLATVDVSHPSAPIKLFGDGSWDNFCAQAVVFKNNLVVLVEGWQWPSLSGIRIYDVTNPSAPVLITDFEQVTTKWVGWDVALDGETLYIAYERATVAFDLRNPLAPALISRHYVPGFSTGVDVEGGRVFIGAYTGGIASAGCTACSDAVFADGWEEYGWYGYTAWSDVFP